MKPSEIREKTVAELQKLKSSLQDELFDWQLKLASGQAEKTHKGRQIRRDIARIVTMQKLRKGA